MIDHTTALYCITADLLKATGHTDDARSQLMDAEVITTALIAALYFGGNIECSRCFMRSTGLMPRMLSKSMVVLANSILRNPALSSHSYPVFMWN